MTHQSWHSACSFKCCVLQTYFLLPQSTGETQFPLFPLTISLQPMVKTHCSAFHSHSFTYSRPTKQTPFLCNLEIQKSQPNLSASDAFQVLMRLFYLLLLLKSRSMLLQLFCRFLPLYGCQEYSFYLLF